MSAALALRSAVEVSPALAEEAGSQAGASSGIAAGSKTIGAALTQMAQPHFPPSARRIVRFRRIKESAAVTGPVEKITDRETITRAKARSVPRRFNQIWTREEGRRQWPTHPDRIDIAKEKP